MDHFAGLDVSVKETSVCIVDEMGKIVREVKVASEPEALLAVLANPAYHFKRIGLEAGPLSQWLYSVLAEAGLPVIWAAVAMAACSARRTVIFQLVIALATRLSEGNLTGIPISNPVQVFALLKPQAGQLHLGSYSFDGAVCCGSHRSFAAYQRWRNPSSAVSGCGLL